MLIALIALTIYIVNEFGASKKKAFKATVVDQIELQKRLDCTNDIIIILVIIYEGLLLG